MIPLMTVKKIMVSIFLTWRVRLSESLRGWKKLDRCLKRRAAEVIWCNQKREPVALTRARVSVNKNTKWEVKITRKYHTASSAIVSKIIRTLSFTGLDFFTKKMKNENARESGGVPCYR